MSSDAKPEIGLVVILPRSPRALSERDDDRVHDLLLELAARHPGEQDMYVVFETGERIAFAKGRRLGRSLRRRAHDPRSLRGADLPALTVRGGPVRSVAPALSEPLERLSHADPEIEDRALHRPERVIVAAEAHGPSHRIEVPQDLMGQIHSAYPSIVRKLADVRIDEVARVLAAPELLGPLLETLIEVLEVIAERPRCERRVVLDPEQLT